MGLMLAGTAERGFRVATEGSGVLAASGSKLGIATLPVFFQEVIEQLLAVMKIRALEAFQRIDKIEETALRRARKKTQGSSDLESFLQSHCGAFALVDKNEFGPESHSERK